MSAPFIAIEGVDGSGKTTQVERLRQRLAQRHGDALAVREPGGTALGEALRDLLLRHAGAAPEALRAKIDAALGPDALETLWAARHVSIVPAVRKPGDLDLAEMTLAEAFAKLEADRGWQAELAEALEDMDKVADEALTWRLGQAAEARNSALRSEQEDRAEYDTGDNGARINRTEREALDALISRIGLSKSQQ